MKRLPLTAALACVLLIAGCATPRQSVATYELAYQGIATAFTDSLRRHVHYDTVTLNALQFANDEANNALKDANARVQKDAPIGVEYAMSRVRAAVKYFADLWADPTKATDAH